MKNISILIILYVFVSCGLAAPEPKKVQDLDDWTLDVKVTHPQNIKVDGRYYWYVILEVSNNTGEDVGFYPESHLLTDTFKIVSSGLGISEKIFEAVKKRHKLQYPFLERMEKTDHKMLQGEDNAKDLAVIWRDFDPEAKSIKLFLKGFSDETAVVEHPTKKDEDGEPVKIYLRKTLELEYAILGDPLLRDAIKLQLKAKDWVMR